MLPDAGLLSPDPAPGPYPGPRRRRGDGHAQPARSQRAVSPRQAPAGLARPRRRTRHGVLADPDRTHVWLSPATCRRYGTGPPPAADDDPTVPAWLGHEQ